MQNPEENKEGNSTRRKSRNKLHFDPNKHTSSQKSTLWDKYCRFHPTNYLLNQKYRVQSARDCTPKITTSMIVSREKYFHSKYFHFISYARFIIPATTNRIPLFFLLLIPEDVRLTLYSTSTNPYIRFKYYPLYEHYWVYEMMIC